MRKVIFVHRGKTGGSTLVSILRATYSPELLFWDRDRRLRRGRPWVVRRVEAILEPWRKYKGREAYQVIHGHFELSKYKRAFPDALYVTFYRHPVQQFISLYHYWLNSPVREEHLIHPHRKILREEGQSLMEFANLHLRPEALGKKFSRNDPDFFDFVGITEDYNRSLRLLRALHIPTLAMDIVPQLVNPEKKVGEKYELDTETAEKLEQMLAPSLVRYQQAVDRFHADCQKAGDCLTHGSP